MRNAQFGLETKIIQYGRQMVLDHGIVSIADESFR